MFLNLLSAFLILSSTCILINSLIRTRNLILQFSSKKVRNRWYTLELLITFFVIGYLTYLIAFYDKLMIWGDLIVPIIFFLGAIFVWLTITLSIQTITNDYHVMHLERENVTDPLTGIYNRRYLDTCIKKEWDCAQHNMSQLSLLLVDIDHFKHVNDTYGHQVGDLVLKHLGKMILETIRLSDIAARYGGDEIVIIAPNTDINSAKSLAERLRQHVENNKLKLANKLNDAFEINVTLSIGVVTCSQESYDSNNLFKFADEALYRAKKEGRNRVAIHSSNSLVTY